MTNWKQTAVLGGIVMTGLLFIMSSPASGQRPVGPNYGQLKQTCANAVLVNDPDNDGIPNRTNQSVEALCLVLAKVMATDPQGSIFDDAAREVKKVLGLSKGCDHCIQAVTDFEALAATNGSELGVVLSMQSACDVQYQDSATRQECKSFVAGTVPVLVDEILATLPPQTMCSSLGFCP